MRAFLLHADGEHGLHEGLAQLLFERLGRLGEFLDEVVLHGILDALRVVPFLFFTYLLLEFIEHRAQAATVRLIARAGSFGPLVGGALGVIPQCGFSTVAANLYTGGVIGLGTLAAVLLSTSDEMLVILLSGNVKITSILLILVYKTVAAVSVGFFINFILRVFRKDKREVSVEVICDGACHCERGIVRSAISHTVSIGVYILVITVALNALLFFLGEQTLARLLPSIPVVSHLISAAVGLIPNCAVSVMLTRLAISGVISEGVMLSGLLSGAGVGLLVLFRMNKKPRENLLIAAILLASGVIFGLIADLLPFISLS